MEPEKPVSDTPKSALRYVLLGAFNAVAAILVSLLTMKDEGGAGKVSLLPPLFLGLVAGAVGGFIYYRILCNRTDTGAKAMAIIIYLVLVLAAFATGVLLGRTG